MLRDGSRLSLRSVGMTTGASRQQFRHRLAGSDRIGGAAEIARAQLRIGEHLLDRLHDRGGGFAPTRSSQYGIVIAMPFDFVADVRCFFGVFCASSNANLSTRSTP